MLKKLFSFSSRVKDNRFSKTAQNQLFYLALKMAPRSHEQVLCPIATNQLTEILPMQSILPIFVLIGLRVLDLRGVEFGVSKRKSYGTYLRRCHILHGNSIPGRI